MQTTVHTATLYPYRAASTSALAFIYLAPEAAGNNGSQHEGELVRLSDRRRPEQIAYPCDAFMDRPPEDRAAGEIRGLGTMPFLYKLPVD